VPDVKLIVLLRRSQLMQRAHFALVALTLLVALSVSSGTSTADPEKTDPWVGAYWKYGRFDTGRQGQFGEAQKITITKDDKGYHLSGPYDASTFTEAKKGVLSDGKGGLGKIYLGFTEFSDGKRVPVLRADFCYEWFVLYGDERDQ
jgi:hypothetical protein